MIFQKNQDNLKLLTLLALLVSHVAAMYIICPVEARLSSVVAVERDQDLGTGQAT